MKTQNIRSLLFVPAEPQKLRKIKALSSDAFILDLEDSIKAGNKKSALEDLKRFLRDSGPGEQTIFVRVNAGRMRDEIRELQTANIEGFVLPKFEHTKTIDPFEGILKEKKLIALIETPMGMINLNTIASHNRIWGIAFGAEDYCCETGNKNQEQFLLPYKTEIVKYARAYGKKCFDTITLEIKDLEKIRSKALRSRDIGFDGKLAIHPAQVPIIDEIYRVQDIEKMLKILDAFAACRSGVLVYEGKIYEKPHIEKIRQELGRLK